jgi:hypothetical protein
MDSKRSQSGSSGLSPVEGNDLHRRMAEVLTLRENVMSLEQVRKKIRHRTTKGSDPTATRQKPRLAL